MSRSINQATIIGNLTRDPEMRYTPNGNAVTSFGVATNRTYTVNGEKREDVEFHNVVAWNKLAELCNQLLRKGRRVYIQGRLQTRSWEGNDGVKRTRTEIIADDMLILDDKFVDEEPPAAVEYLSDEEPPREDATTDSEAAKTKKGKKATEAAITEDDIPF